MKFGLSIKSVFDDIKLACIYLLEDEKVKPKHLIEFFGLNEDTVYDWSKRIGKGEILEKRQNLYSNLFLEDNKYKIKKSDKVSIDKIREIIWTFQNCNFPVVVITRYYGLNEKFMSNLSTFSGNCRKYENEFIPEPDLDIQDKIRDRLELLNRAYNNNQEIRKKAAIWLLLNTNLTENEISIYTFLSYSTIHRIRKIYNDNELSRMCYGIKKVNLFSNELNEYWYTID